MTERTGPRFPCRRCGACCRELLLEISGLDLLREPRWAPHLRRYAEVDYDNWRAEPEAVLWMVEAPGGCPFLARDHRCRIYPTRPDMCVRFEPIVDGRCAHNPRCIFAYGERRNEHVL